MRQILPKSRAKQLHKRSHLQLRLMLHKRLLNRAKQGTTKLKQGATRSLNKSPLPQPNKGTPRNRHTKDRRQRQRQRSPLHPLIQNHRQQHTTTRSNRYTNRHETRRQPTNTTNNNPLPRKKQLQNQKPKQRLCPQYLHRMQRPNPFLRSQPHKQSTPPNTK